MYEDAQDQAQDDSAATLILIKRGINQGMQKFGAILNRQWRATERTFSLKADQQYYQMPEDCIRPKSIVVTIGSVEYDLKEVSNGEDWRELNAYSTTERSTIPEKYYVKGGDLFGIYPIPSSDQTDAGLIAFEPRMRRMTAADYTDGTIALTAGSNAVVGTGTTFTAAMVGRVLTLTDGSDQDGIEYKIDSYTDATHITLENYYGGNSGTGLSYKIGEVADIPEEFHEALIDYALYRVFKRRKDRRLSLDSKAAFDEAILLCKESYSSTSTSQYTRARIHRGSPGGYRHSNREYTVTGS